MRLLSPVKNIKDIQRHTQEQIQGECQPDNKNQIKLLQEVLFFEP